MNIKFFVLEQAPVLSPEQLMKEMPWLGAAPAEWLRPRVLELCYTNVELDSFADDLGHDSGPFKWNPERRSLIQAEIDAALLHLYDLDKKQAEWILNSFTVLRKYEERDHGGFRTKQLVMAAYDAMEKAKEVDTVYETLLIPPLPILGCVIRPQLRQLRRLRLFCRTAFGHVKPSSPTTPAPP